MNTSKTFVPWLSWRQKQGSASSVAISDSRGIVRVVSHHERINTVLVAPSVRCSFRSISRTQRSSIINGCPWTHRSVAGRPVLLSDHEAARPGPKHESGTQASCQAVQTKPSRRPDPHRSKKAGSHSQGRASHDGQQTVTLLYRCRQRACPTDHQRHHSAGLCRGAGRQPADKNNQGTGHAVTLT